MLSKRARRTNGAKGGRKRKRNLTPERRREIAQKAAITRWAKQPEQPEQTA